MSYFWSTKNILILWILWLIFSGSKQIQTFYRLFTNLICKWNMYSVVLDYNKTNPVLLKIESITSHKWTMDKYLKFLTRWQRKHRIVSVITSILYVNTEVNNKCDWFEIKTIYLPVETICLKNSYYTMPLCIVQYGYSLLENV